jgi:hypothetical protein
LTLLAPFLSSASIWFAYSNVSLMAPILLYFLEGVKEHYWPKLSLQGEEFQWLPQPVVSASKSCAAWHVTSLAVSPTFVVFPKLLDM